jgi:methylamine dehydrogenase accessory protein MauD
MDAALVIARLVLAAVFLTAGLAKLADREGSRQAMRDFGVPAPLAGPLGTLLPLAELTVAVALVFPATAWAGALAAGVLLLLFVQAIAVNLARGRQPDCHCFGQLHSAPAGWSTLLRNLALALVAVFVVVAGADDVGPGPADLSTAALVAIAAGAVVLAQTWLMFQLFRQHGRLLLRVDALEAQLAGHAPSDLYQPGLEIGSEAPDFNLPGLHGEHLTLGSLRAAGKPVLLLFTDPGCGPCSALLPRVARWQREHAGKLTLALVSRGSAEDNRGPSDEHGVSSVLLQRDREVAEAYEAPGTPAAVLVSPEGMVASGVAFGPDAVVGLMEEAIDAPPATLIQVVRSEDGPAVGRLAPEIELEDLDGRPFSLLDLEGERVLVLFWDPGCGFCARMLSDLAAWAADPPAGAPTLVVVSRGTVEANRALDLAATVLIDPDFTTSRSYGATGTPMGVLIDEEGRIASQVAAGASAIFELLSVETTS